jgi:hypothetical protein
MKDEDEHLSFEFEPGSHLVYLGQNEYNIPKAKDHPHPHSTSPPITEI